MVLFPFGFPGIRAIGKGCIGSLVFLQVLRCDGMNRTKQAPSGQGPPEGPGSFVHAPSFVGFEDSAPSRKILWLSFAGVMLLALFLFGFKMEDRGIWSSHEAIAGQIARAMVRSGDYGVERFETGRGYNNEKPPLYYWGVSLFARVTGEVNDLTIRLPSTVSAVLLVALVFWMGTRMFSLPVGVMASLILMTSIHYRWLARVGRIDMVLALLVVASGFALYFACRGERSRRSWVLCAAAYGLMGLGVLAKGPVGIVLVFCGIGPILLLEKGWEEIGELCLAGTVGALVLAGLCLGGQGWPVLVPLGGLVLGSLFRKRIAVRLFSPHLLGAAVLLLVASPWFFWVHHETQGQFTRDFFIYHNFVRFFPQGVAGYEALKHRPFWFYIPHLFTSMLPWSLLLTALPRKVLKRDRPSYDLRRFLVVWSGVSFLFLSLSSFKRADYLLPVLPLLSLLLAWCLANFYEEDPDGKGIRTALTATGVLLATATAALWLLALLTAFGDPLSSPVQTLVQHPAFESQFNSDDANGLLTYLRFFQTPENRVSILLFSVLMTAGVAGIFLKRRSLKWVFSLLVVLAAAFHTVHEVKVAPFLEPFRTQRTLAAQIQEIVGKEGKILMVETEPHDLVFYLDREVLWFPHVYPDRSLARVLAEEAGKPLYFILDRDRYRRMKKAGPLPGDVVVESIPQHFDGIVVLRPSP